MRFRCSPAGSTPSARYYMITGATAAIIYGQPRLTNDLDVVLALRDEHLPPLLAAFPESQFYLPPESVIRVEQARSQRGHFNILHLDSGYKADVYLAGSDVLHAWALPLRRRIPWTDSLALPVAPPEYVILRKLEYFREVDRRSIRPTSAPSLRQPRWTRKLSRRGPSIAAQTAVTCATLPCSAAKVCGL